MGGLLVILIDYMIFAVAIPKCDKYFYVSSFFFRIARLWDSLPIECFPLTYDINGFKCKINRHRLTVGSFYTPFLVCFLSFLLFLF